MKATVSLDHGMTFLATANSGHTVQIGASPSVGGDDDGPRPLELILLSLGSCTAMDVISILRKKRQNVTSFDVQLDADQTDTQPHVFTHIMIRYIIRGHNVRPAAVERAIELSVTKYCPAQAMLEKAVTIEHSYEIIEETASVENEQILAPAP